MNGEFQKINWDIHLEGRTWSRKEFDERWPLTPEKFELHDGKMFWLEEERIIHLLGMLLEQVGAEKAIESRKEEHE
jgi:hypothetical protein